MPNSFVRLKVNGSTHPSLVIMFICLFVRFYKVTKDTFLGQKMDEGLFSKEWLFSNWISKPQMIYADH